MYYNFPSLFKKEIAEEIGNLIELTIDVHNVILDMGIKDRWTKLKDFEEYGFYIDSSDKSRNLFCGMWYDLWETKGIPFCLCLDWKSKNLDHLKYDLEKFSKVTGSNLYFIDYQGYPTIYFDTNFFEKDDVANSIINLVKRIVEDLNFGRYFTR